MYAAKRPYFRPAILFFVLASFFMAACSSALTTGNWPGLSTDGEKVYVATGTSVIAYDVENQREAWTFPQERSTAQIFAAPSVQDGRVVIGDFGASGGFFSPSKIVTLTALDDTNQGLPSQLWAQSEAVHASIVAAPLQVGDQVFVGTADNHIVALNATNGALLWDFETGNSIWGQPAYKDGVVYVAVLDRNVYALDADSGELVWDEPAQLEGALASQPVLNTDIVYVTSFDGQLHALSINSGEHVWSAEAHDWIWGAPVFVGDVVYFADVQGNVYAVDSETGDEIWTQTIGTAVQTTPIFVNDTIYIAAEGNKESGQGALVALSADDGTQLWQQTTPAALYTTPVVVDDVIVVALVSESALLIGFDLETGAQKWVYTPPTQ